MPATLFRGGDILWPDAVPELPEALAVRDGRIVGTGSVAELGTADSEVFDLAGGCLIPGLIDHHVHLTAVGLAVMNREAEGRLFLDLAGGASADGVVERVAERAARVTAGDWILGMGWNQHDWGTHELPDRRALDRAVPDHPVFLVRVDAHSAWVNDAALRRAGIDASWAPPPGGSTLRAADGTPTGVLLERAVEPLLDKIPVPAGWEVRAAFGAAARAFAQRGVTEVFDAGFMASPAIVSMGVDFELYLELLGWADAEDPLPVDVNLMVPAPSPLADKIVADPDAYRQVSERIRVSHIKLYADGAFGSRGAALSHPYADDPSSRGIMRMTDEELVAETRRALEAGLDVATHAIGDDAVHRVMNAYRRVVDDLGDVVPSRLRIEHFGYSSEDDMRAAADAGFLLVAQPNFIDPDDTGVAMEDHRLGADNTARVYPWKTLIDQGANLALSSDYYVEPGPALLDFYAACSRANRSGRPAGGWHPSERLSRSEALRLATTLWASGGIPRRPLTGAAAPADLTVLSANPLTADESELLRIEALATMRRGAFTYRR